ncbi:hypothetical protein AB0H43_20125 [Hamadaea sp. NPDC050747]
MAATPYSGNIFLVERRSKTEHHDKESTMFTSPQTVLELAKLHHQELVAEAQRNRLSARVRRAARQRSARAHSQTV